jgi:hypothetical protein
MKNMYWFGYIHCPGRETCELERDVSGYDEGCTCHCPSLEGLTAATVTHEDFEDMPMYFYLFE